MSPINQCSIRHMVLFIALSCVIVLHSGLSYAAVPGLPFTEDFVNQDLRDNNLTNANWSAEEQAVFLAWQQQQPTVIGGGIGASVDVGTEIENTVSVALGDVNDDGYLDVVVANDQSAHKVYLNVGLNGGATATGEFELVVGSFGTGLDTARSLALGDIDGDGDLDAVVGNLDEANQFYLNDGSGAFGVGVPLGIETDFTFSVALGDIDSDGDLDCIVGNSIETNKLYLNDGNGVFSSTGSDIGIEVDFTTSIALGDLNNDGFLDVVVGNSGNLNDTDPANDGQLNRFYLNTGLGTFPLIGIDIGNEADKTLSVILVDIDTDNELDIIVGNTEQNNKLYVNNSGTFFTTPVSIGLEIEATVGMALGDINNDGRADLLILNSGALDASDPPVPLGEVNRFYINSGNGGFNATSIELSVEEDITVSAALGDLDNDGDLDIILGNNTEINKRHMNQNQGGFSSVFSEIGIELDNTQDIAIGDIDGDGYLDIVEANAGDALIGASNRFYLNDGTGVFDSGTDIGTNEEDPTLSVVLADLDGDLDLDLVVGNYAEVNKVHINNTILPGTVIFAAGTDIGTVTTTTFSLLLSHVNNDSDLDIIEANFGDFTVGAENKLYLGNGDGTFNAGVDIGVEVDFTTSLALVDIDGDLDLDLFTGNFAATNKLYFNDGLTTAFTSATTPNDIDADLRATNSLNLEDVDGDLDIDLITGGGAGSYLYRNDGNNFDALALPVTSEAIGSSLENTQKIILADIDGDSDPDVITGNSGQTNKFYLNDGFGVFADGVSIGAASDQSRAILLADLDVDGVDYFVVANADQKNQVYSQKTFVTHLGRVVSEIVNGVENITAAQLGATATLNTPETINTSITYYLSNNNGTQWFFVIPGETFSFPALGNQLRWRAELKSLSPNISPLITSITVDTDYDLDDITDSVDDDDDNDTWSDVDEGLCLTDPLNETSIPSDFDADEICDVVDDDDDNDTWTDADEVLCSTDPLDNMSLPLDTDNDDVCDAVDTDDDDDGVDDDFPDNCPLDANADQANLDGDTFGDVCDDDRDGDTLLNGDEITNGTDPDDADSDDDGVNDNIDAFPNDPAESNDTDSDGVGDNADNCMMIPNTDQGDFDNNMIGDACDDGDGDNILNNIDEDDDNDGIPDAEELGADTDGDGINDVFDLDSDNDGISDLRESGLLLTVLTVLDSDNNGRIDNTNSFGANGLVDSIEVTPESGTVDYNTDTIADAPQDIDGDLVPDFRDLDKDNDALTDLRESGLSPAEVVLFDTDNNGSIDAPILTPANLVGVDGVLDSIQGDIDEASFDFISSDTDSDGVFDAQDLDSDNDGIPDLMESGLAKADIISLDTDNDGRIDPPSQTATNTVALDGIVNSIQIPFAFNLSDPLLVLSNYSDQDEPAEGTVTLEDNGLTLSIVGNRWQKIILPYTVTSDTILEFDFESTSEAEFVGIMFDNNNDFVNSDFNNSFIVQGTQSNLSGSNPIRSFMYTGNGSSQHFTIPVGESFTGTFSFLVFVHDDDSGASDNAKFSNVVVYEPTDRDLGALKFLGTDINGDNVFDVGDTDIDGVRDAIDLDSDNDGLIDILEAGLVDVDVNGQVDGVVNENGVVVSALVNTTTIPDADADDIPDNKELDSDNDGNFDITITDIEPNGLIDGSDIPANDLDRDGVYGSVDTAPEFFGLEFRQLVFAVQPVTSAGGETLPAIVIEIQDVNGTVVNTATNTVTLTINNNPVSGTLSGTTSVDAVNGVATFSDLNINLIGTAYTLDATAGSVTPVTSTAFDITAGSPSQLMFTTQPANSAGGATLANIVVEIQDAGGNLVNTAGDNVTIAIDTNPSSGTLSGVQTVAAVNGVATFSGLSIDLAGTGYSLAATSGTLTLATSTAFDVLPGSPTQLVFSVQPLNASGGATLLDVVVAIQDVGGNVVTDASNAVTLAISNNPSTGVLSGTLEASPVNGIVTFNDLSIDLIGTGYTLNATAAGLISATSTPFNIATGAPAQLIFSVQPVNNEAATSLADILVEVQDAGGNTVTNASNEVTLAINNNPSLGSLSGTVSDTPINGVVTFSGLSIDLVGTAYTLDATATGLAAVTSTAFNITVGSASQLVFSAQPVGNTGGAIFSDIVVEIQDAGGNLVSTSTDSVSLAINNNPGAGTLSGTATLAAVNGVATFSGLSIDLVGTAYTLDATSGSLTLATSTPFDITVGSSSQLAFTTQPANTSGGATLADIVVEVQDAGGNLVSTATDSVSLVINNNPTTGTLSGTSTLAAVNGVATFSGLSIDLVGTAYTLDATSGSLTLATSAAFDITLGSASQLAITTEPVNTSGGSTLSSVLVEIQDAGGNLVNTATNSVALAINNNPASGVLSGTTTVAAVNGVAAFNDLSINTAGIGYTLNATSGVLTLATSAAFDITIGSASQLVFSAQPSNTSGGVTLLDIVVEVQDVGGNVVSGASDNVTLSINSNPSSGNLSGTLTVAAINGVATFNDISIDAEGIAYTLGASATGLSPAISTPFNIAIGGPTQLIFSVQPVNAEAAATLSDIIVEILDAGGNVVTTATDTVVLSFNSNPSGAILSGTLSATPVNGIVTFSGLSIDVNGDDYTLDATAVGLATATSTTFDIAVGVPTQLVFNTQPMNNTGGVTLSSIVVEIRDANDNVVTTADNMVSLSINSNPASGTLSGTLNVAAVSGIATFDNVSIDLAGTGYTLDVAAAGLVPITSSTFDITVGAAAQVAFGSQPVNGEGGAILSSVTVEIQDAGGNLINTAINDVTLAINNNPSTGSLSGTTTVAAVNGIATFDNISIDSAGTAYTLEATATTLIGNTSTAFNIVVGNASQLAFGAPLLNTAGGSILSGVAVEIQDAGGNLVTSAINTIAVSINNNPGAGVLSGTFNVAAVNGVATFGDLSIDLVGAAYNLAATSGGLAAGISNDFDISSGIASQLSFNTEPVNGIGGAALSSFTVEIQDAGGNVIAGNNTITLAISNNPSTGALSGTLAVAAVNGIATFDNVVIDIAGLGYTLNASSFGLTPSTSAGFDITAGSASQLVFSTQPLNTPGGVTLPNIEVQVQDSFGNFVSTANNVVTLGINNNPVGGVLSGTLSIAAVNGVATFSDLSINLAGTGYSLNASAAALVPTASSSFNIVAGGASQLAFTTQPLNTASGATLSAVVVEVLDAGGNLVNTADDLVTLAINPNPALGILSGVLSVNAVNGVATFDNVSIDLAGTAYTLNATAAGLVPVTSSTFDITVGVPTQLVFNTQPNNASGGAILSSVVVEIRDAGGNIVAVNNNVILAINNNPSSGVLSGTLNVAAVNGIATFDNISIDSAGTGYTLEATATSLTSTTSTAFNITVGSASQLAFGAEPTESGGGEILSSVTLELQDAGGNVVTTANDLVTLLFNNNASSASLSGTLSLAAVNGIATFSDLSIDLVGSGYSLDAGSGSFTASSNLFNVVAGSPSQLIFITEPVDTIGDEALPNIQVEIRDAGGNFVGTATNIVILSIGANPAAGSLTGASGVAAVGGIATFSGLSINNAGADYTLIANSTGIAGPIMGATSALFTIDPQPDEDSDGVFDVNDNCPSVPNNDQENTDGDSEGNACDDDNDNDGVDDINDAFPLDPTETLDTDNDFIGNNTDSDDDGDSFGDAIEAICLSDSLDANSIPIDSDDDGICDAVDAFPNDSSRSRSDEKSSGGGGSIGFVFLLALLLSQGFRIRYDGAHR